MWALGPLLLPYGHGLVLSSTPSTRSTTGLTLPWPTSMSTEMPVTRSVSRIKTLSDKGKGQPGVWILRWNNGAN